MKSWNVVVMRNCLVLLLLLIVGLLAAFPADKGAYAISDNITPSSPALLQDDAATYPVMHITQEQKRAWAEEAEHAPLAPIDEGIRQQLATRTQGASFSLLSLIQYTPAQQNQVSCGNCWVWTGTGVLEVALNVQRGIKDRLSTQYFNSNCTTCGASGMWACCGGNPVRFVSFYNNTLHQAIPWSNTNASWQDSNRCCPGQPCGNYTTSVPAGTISTTPNYPITSIGPAQAISTHTGNEATNIANIKNILNQNKGVYFAFYLANGDDWDDFTTFWGAQAESVIWSGGYSCGEYYDLANGAGGHAVLCVGYNDDDANPANHYWLMLNSWGTTVGRPNDLFRVPMHYDYNCADSDGYYNTEWWSIPVTFTIPVASTDEIGIYDPNTQKFYLRASDGSYTIIKFGALTTNIPITGDWDVL